MIEPPLTIKTHFPAGSAFDFSLLLMGEANTWLPYFIYAFEQMGQIGIGKKLNAHRGRFSLEKVQSNNGVIYSSDDHKLTPKPVKKLGLKSLESFQGQDLCLKLTLETPLRLKFENKLQADLPFHLLVRAMLRRISSLMNVYGDGEPVLDYPGLVKKAETVKTIEKCSNKNYNLNISHCKQIVAGFTDSFKKAETIKTLEKNLSWYDWHRYSFRQEEKMLMGGMTGSVTYEGPIEEYLPLIEFCEQVHLGKQTTFGLGKIKTELVP